MTRQMINAWLVDYYIQRGMLKELASYINQLHVSENERLVVEVIPLVEQAEKFRGMIVEEKIVA